MKVWILQTGEPIHSDKGNQRAQRSINLSDTLIARGHKVVLWTSAFNHSNKSHRSKKYKVIKIDANLEIRLIPSSGYKKHIGLARLIDHFQLGWNLKKILKNEKDKPDIVFIGYPPIETSAVMTKWLLKKNIPSILDFIDLWPSMYVEVFPKIFQPIARLMFEPYFYLSKRTVNDATAVTSTAPTFLKWVLNFAGKEKGKFDKIFRLTSPQGKVSKNELELAEKWWISMGLKKNSPIIFFVGTFMSVYDFKPVMIAAEKLKNVQFVLCGDGYYLNSVKEMMKDLDNVIFPGWVNRPEIVSLANKSIASLAPYKNIENYIINIPNKIVDALILGLPILSPLEGEVKNLIKTHQVGFSYNEKNDLSECIQTLLDSQEIQDKMSKNVKKLYNSEFEFNKVYNQMVTDLEEMFKNHSS